MIFGIWGEDKSGKTSLACSLPKPLVIMEFDIGGFSRANKNLPEIKIKDDLESGLIIWEKFPIPFQIGSINLQEMTIRPSKIIVGMKELFYQWLARYIQHLDDSNIATIVVDTATLLWEITCQGYLQEKQELQLPLKADGMGSDGKSLRVQLQPPEYREPNTRMRGVVYQAQLREKHLVLTHHATDEYGPILLKDGGISDGKTGKRIRHGWTWLGDAADIIVHTYYNNSFHCKVELAGEPGLLGMEFNDPTYDKITNAIRMIRGD